MARGLADVQADDVLLIFAASPGQVAFDGDSTNSPFAESLAKRIIQPGLPVQMLGFKIRDDVLAATAGRQRPYTSGSITGDDLYLIKAIERPTTSEGGLGLRVGPRGSGGFLSRRAVFEQPKPIGEESWFTAKDYPSGALQTGREGRVTYNLSIDETGAVTRCQIVISSTSSALDKVTCDLLKARAQFRPQMDSEGNVSPGNYVSSLLWENPN